MGVKACAWAVLIAVIVPAPNIARAKALDFRKVRFIVECLIMVIPIYEVTKKAEAINREFKKQTAYCLANCVPIESI
jgi:hypothetical protein